jgi:hypothetical protein
MMKFFRRKEKVPTIPLGLVEDSWEQKRFENNVSQGIQSLAEGRTISIANSPDSRSYELALEIKRQYILRKQAELAKRIEINSFGSSIEIKWKLD